MSLKKIAFLASCLALTAFTPAHADDAYKGFQAGDILVRGRLLGVMPDISTSTVSGIGGGVDASNSFEPEADVSYFVTPNFAVEAIAAITRHHLTDKGSSLGNVDLGHVSLLPPTVTGQWHFLPQSEFNPYVGAGINYTMFFDTSLPSGGAVHSISYRDGFGGAIQAGFDYHLTDNWFLNMDVKHLFLSTEAKINGGAITSTVALNPTIAGIGVGYKF